MKRIKIAFIGFNKNSHALPVFKTLKKLSDVFEIVGYHLPEGEREKFPDKVTMLDGFPELTLEEIMENPEIEAVAVETEEIYLTKYATLAAEHGKHIHMEKPGGVSLSDFECLIKAVKRGGKAFSTGYMYRHNPEVIKLLADVRSGELGEIISVEAQMNCIHNESVRSWLEAFPGGMMFFLGCHLIDLILLIQGMPKRVIPMNRSSGVGGVTADDFGMAVLEYDKGISFAKTSAVEIGGYMRRQLVISGTKRTVELKPLEATPGEGCGYLHPMYTGVAEYSAQGWHVAPEQRDSVTFDRYENMLRAFAAYVRGEQKNPYTPDYELELFKVLLEACGK